MTPSPPYDRPLVHIGYHKTGTSWLQKNLFIDSNKNFLPLSNRDSGQSSISRHFIMDDEQLLLSSFENNQKRINEELQKIIAVKETGENKIAVLSQERLSGNPHAGGFDAHTIAWRIKTVFPEARILIVIREQKSFIRSAYFQYLKQGGTGSLSKYLNARYDGVLPFFSPHHINYLPLIRRYQELFGQESVLIVPYETMIPEPGAFIQRIENFLKISINMSGSALDERVNYLRSPFFRYHLRQLNRFNSSSSLNAHSVLGNRHAERILQVVLSRIDSFSAHSLDRNLLAKLDLLIARWAGDRYKDANEELAHLINEPLQDFGYY